MTKEEFEFFDSLIESLLSRPIAQPSGVGRVMKKLKQGAKVSSPYVLKARPGTAAFRKIPEFLT